LAPYTVDAVVFSGITVSDFLFETISFILYFVEHDFLNNF
jgi:hypothetical protein